MLKAKVALVTGASRGIGRAIAHFLAEHGTTVVGTSTSEQGAAGISEFAHGLVLDVTRQQSIDDLLAKMADTVGMPDILVNNAGITADNLFMRMKDEEWDRVIDANLSSAFKLMRACIRPMIKNKWGRIINISSVVALTGNPGQANYSASKAGLIGLSKSIAREVASRGITINVIAPGFIETDMTKDLTAEQQEKLLQQIPAGRMGQATDIAAAVQFLASDYAGYITGETLHINGGMLMS
jgi:3-oxoacyl-[acyl-carrier protein] reductase